jgi:hypothetical protein
VAIKTEIAWRRLDAEGRKVDVYARRFGGKWEFHQRHRRNDLWRRIEDPSLEDWFTLLDSLERRVPRSLFTPDDVKRVRQTILELHPGTQLP